MIKSDQIYINMTKLIKHDQIYINMAALIYHHPSQNILRSLDRMTCLASFKCGTMRGNDMW